jgi:DNA-binding phage protein
MDSCEDGCVMYCKFANEVAMEAGITREQIDKELEPFV